MLYRVAQKLQNPHTNQLTLKKTITPRFEPHCNISKETNLNKQPRPGLKLNYCLSSLKETKQLRFDCKQQDANPIKVKAIITGEYAGT